VLLAWNIDLMSGYESSFLDDGGRRARRMAMAGQLARWLRSHDTVVLHGHSDPWMLFAVAACRGMGIPTSCAATPGPKDRRPGFAAVPGTWSHAVWSLPAPAGWPRES